MSAQKVGIDGGGFVESIHLKLLAPERYGDLEHPGDAWSFDIFTQVGALLQLPADENPLGGLAPTQILAAGESQSAACLVTYINAVDPHAQLFDGFFVHGRPASGVSIDGVFIPASQRSGMEATRRGDLVEGRAHPRRRPGAGPRAAERDRRDPARAAAWPSSPTPTASGSGRWRARRTPTPTRSARAVTTTAR